MWSRNFNGGSNKRKFFFSDLISELNLENILLEAYILVSKCHFTYSDVKGMTKIVRAVFLKLHSDELKAQKDAIEQYNN